MVTDVPPAMGPLDGLIAETVGPDEYVYSVFAELEPPEVVTTTLAAPAEPAGATAVMVVALTTTTLVAAVPPMVTPVAPVRLAPVMVTDVPPAMGPLDGLIAETVGTDE